MPSSECVSHSGNSEDQHDADSNTKVSAAEKKSKSKKKGRKSKKVNKKESNQSSLSSQSKERSQASQRKRAHILQRIRRDSLNTSSDEEHSLSSNSSDTFLTAGACAEHAQTDLTKEDSNAHRSVEDIKEELKKRIFSKKPPAYFETPGTDPIYHEVGI